MCGPIRDDLVWESKSGRQHRYEAATSIKQQNNVQSTGFPVFEIHAPSVGISLGSVVALALLCFSLLLGPVPEEELVVLQMVLLLLLVDIEISGRWCK